MAAAAAAAPRTRGANDDAPPTAAAAAAAAPRARGANDDTARKLTPAWVYMSPLGLTLLPLIRTTFKHNPVLQGRLFVGVCVAGVAHGVALITGSYTASR